MLVAVGSRPLPSIDLGPLDPALKGLGLHIDQGTDLAAGFDRRFAPMRGPAFPVLRTARSRVLVVVLAWRWRGSIPIARSEPAADPRHVSRRHRPRVRREIVHIFHRAPAGSSRFASWCSKILSRAHALSASADPGSRELVHGRQVGEVLDRRPRLVIPVTLDGFLASIA